jgi:NTP pyrophosphatase (non-canonical NTP hydrolase)
MYTKYGSGDHETFPPCAGHPNDPRTPEIYEEERIVEFNDIEQNVIAWAFERGIVTGKPMDWDGSKAQFIKLAEELGELANALAKQKPTEARDAIGDMLVVLTNIAYQLDDDMTSCYEHAWNQIKDRTGKTVDGVFIKEES